MTTVGDTNFSEGFRNPCKLQGANPNEASTIEDKYKLILEQRERIMSAFLAEHAGLLPSQIIQVTKTLSNGDVAWYLEVME